MTQISLKLFNKSPFVRNDTGEPFESAKAPGTMPRGHVYLVE